MSNTPPIRFQEVLDIMENSPIEDAMTDERLLNFIDCVDEAGMEILKDFDDELLLGAIGFIQSAAITPIINSFMEKGDVVKAMQAMSLSQSELISKLITIAFKMSVGLAALEEWK